MRKLWLIASMVFRKNIRSFSWWSLVLTPLLAVGAIGVIQWYVSHTHEPARVVVVAPRAVASAFKASADGDITYTVAATKTAGQRQLRHEDADALLVVPRTLDHAAHLYSRDNGQSVDAATVRRALSGLKTMDTAQQLGLSAAQLAQLNAPAQLRTQSVSFKARKMVVARSKTDWLKVILSLAVGALMYVFLLSYGTIVAQEIATEKGSRIEESILTAIKASTQFYGKLLGVTVLLLVQIGAYAGVAAIAWLLRDRFAVVRQFLATIDWSGIGWPFVLVMVAFFVIGIISYTVLAALCGSLVSNQEQAGMALQPVLYLGVIGYMAALNVSSGSGPILRTMSYIPFLSPMVAPARFGVGQMGLGMVTLSLIISVVFLVAFTWFSARAYRDNVLVYSDSGLFKALKKSWTLSRSSR
ncbi:ABC transporter permease [Lacticaseibacillus thailandensis]|uniref:ABC superfamily ATP binding cassette transporter, membrane protein n=1 Tax=Lacticaseibacillus thailandensis DSM 22698 = JCM 13996 TaxID=1423810 RepID=A0A0R2CED9_9LACO|nr:ABC transporter permease [Lacticaseibacillus thailandensis]KRM86745.1 ABC superfamily ATP binding cassette transporter, membrane protein [Lacticaseibacillus thailandensis DSM 22698 = JCM 13996]